MKVRKLKIQIQKSRIQTLPCCSSTRTTRVIDGGEPPEFQSLFKSWRIKGQVQGITKQASCQLRASSRVLPSKSHVS